MINTRRDPLWRLFALAVVAIAVATLGVVGWIHSNTALDKAKSVGDCVNTVLATRGPSAARVNQAQRAFVIADDAYNHAEIAILTVPKNEAATVFRDTFLPALRTKTTASDALNDALADQAAVQDKHPLGKC